VKWRVVSGARRQKREGDEQVIYPMPIVNRTHAITYRLGTREYEELVRTVASTGARSLSDFTRMAVLNQIVSESLDLFLTEQIDPLMSSLDTFESRVRELRRQIRQLNAKSDLHVTSGVSS
jgi:hypothetical protein